MMGDEGLSVRLLRWLAGRRLVGARFVNRWLFACEIGRRLPASIVISHPLGIVIHCDVALGERIQIQQFVTIGLKLGNKVGKHTDGTPGVCPIIEDDVVIGCGAAILGPVRIGKGAIVGANAVVTKDVPPGAVVVGANRLLEMEGEGSTK
jgi:serine acetyltransferase